MAEVTRRGFLDMQVCVPKTYNDGEAVAFAEKEYPCGTTGGWQIVRTGSKWLGGHPERAQCHDHEDHCHIMLEA